MITTWEEKERRALSKMLREVADAIELKVRVVDFHFCGIVCEYAASVILHGRPMWPAERLMCMVKLNERIENEGA